MALLIPLNTYYNQLVVVNSLYEVSVGVNPIGIVKNSWIIRTPAFFTGCCPHKIGSAETPWQDIYNVSKGHI